MTRWTILAVLVAVTAVAAADDDALAAAEREYQAGYRALAAGDCRTALVHYQRSYALAPRPRTLFNTAVCQEDLGQLARAWRTYQEFLATAEPRDAAIAETARARSNALKAQLLGRATIDSVPSGAEVYLDGDREPRGTTPLELVLEPGRHHVRLTAPGFPTLERSFEIGPEGTATLSLELGAPATITTEVAPPDAELADVAGPVTGRGRLHIVTDPRGHHERIEIGPGEDVQLTIQLPPRRARALTAGLAGAGAGALVVGGVLGVAALRDVTSADPDDRDRGKVRALVADGLFVTGAVALIVAWRRDRARPPLVKVERTRRTR